MRGMFARGWDNGRGKDTGRSILSDQAAEFEAHTHAISDAGEHNHTLNTAGDHTHVIDTTDITGSFDPGYHNPNTTGVFSEQMIFGSETSDNNNGRRITSDASHAHTMQDAGDHTHTVGDAGLHTHSVNQTGGSETRPENVALMYCIKY